MAVRIRLMEKFSERKREARPIPGHIRKFLCVIAKLLR
jgi:hypothetical protein